MSLSAVYKYPFLIDDVVAVDMPAGAEVLLVDAQNGVPTIWAMVNPNAIKTRRRFRVIGTGHSFDRDRLTHVASFQQPPFVWHLFEVTA